LEDDGTFPSQTVYGVQFEVGAYGGHSWSKTSLGLDYRGDYRQTTRASGYDGTNQAVALNLDHQLSRRISLQFREVGGTTNRAFGGFAAPALPDPSLANLVNNEVFDVRSYFNLTSGAITYQQSARGSYQAQVTGSFVRRPDPGLIGSTAYSVFGAYDYRFTSRFQFGSGYIYVRMGFPSAYGTAEAHGAFIRGSRRLTRSLSATFNLGLLSLTTIGTESVQLSPEVAALLGVTTGVAAFKRQSWMPQAIASLIYQGERSVLSAVYATGLSPGNGVYLSSQTDSVAVGYSYAGIRKLSLGATARYQILRSKSLTADNLTTASAGAGINYALTRLINLSSQLDYRTFESPGLRGREGIAFTLGISVSGARIPLSIW
jgi:hypothetical protein